MIQRLLHFMHARKNDSSPDRDNLMTLDEVAARLGVDAGVVRRAIAKGDLPAVRTGRELKVERGAFEQALAIAGAHYGPAP